MVKKIGYGKSDKLLPRLSDYRGFGDSSPVALSESTVVSDARTALAWITDKLGDKAKVSFLFVWVFHSKDVRNN